MLKAEDSFRLVLFFFSLGEVVEEGEVGPLLWPDQKDIPAYVFSDVGLGRGLPEELVTSEVVFEDDVNRRKRQDLLLF